MAPRTDISTEALQKGTFVATLKAAPLYMAAHELEHCVLKRTLDGLASHLIFTMRDYDENNCKRGTD